MTLIVRSLASGSSGNALLIMSARSSLLIDAGIATRTLESILLQQERCVLQSLSAVALTHEHSDHVRGLPKLLTYEIPMIATAGTFRALDIAPSNRTIARIGIPIELDDLRLTPVPISHDATEPCAYLIESEDATVLLLTDLGQPDPSHASLIARADLLIIEANHDEGMLARGPYPPHLKRRVSSAIGHLSNVACADLIVTGLSSRSDIPTIWLSHLSETNNRPVLARETVTQRLLAKQQITTVTALPRRQPGPRWRSDARPITAVQTTFAF